MSNTTIPYSREDTTSLALTELSRAVSKFPYWPTDPLHAMAVVNEEIGELNKALLQYVYEPQKATLADVDEELIQSIAMLIRLRASLKKYIYSSSPEHVQSF